MEAFLPTQELDEALGLFKSVSTFMNDGRTGRNIQHDVTNLLRQSVYTRLPGYGEYLFLFEYGH